MVTVAVGALFRTTGSSQALTGIMPCSVGPTQNSKKRLRERGRNKKDGSKEGRKEGRRNKIRGVVHVQFAAVWSP